MRTLFFLLSLTLSFTTHAKCPNVDPCPKGMDVMARRGGVLEPATVQGYSDEEGNCFIKFKKPPHGNEYCHVNAITYPANYSKKLETAHACFTMSKKHLEKAVAILIQAFETGNDSEIKNILSPNSGVTIATIHSIYDNIRIKPKRLNGTSEFIHWLKSLHRIGQGDPPWVGTREGPLCGERVCRFESTILHNHVYLDEVYFDFDESGRPYVTKIRLLDGD